jgi:BirA family biotin operon repressor/biotin-[acetyl-CoA-carboxylase] ligase
VIHLDTRGLVGRLHTLESVAVIPRVASTNLVARRVVNECIENELSLPQAMIIAGEQFAGRGRNARSWSSPPGKGIYATTLLTRPVADLPMIPLEMANIVAGYLREVFRIDACIKWPNDVLVRGGKIAGILIEARIQDDRVFLLIGIGVNVEPVKDDDRPNATSISEVARGEFHGIDAATEAFVEYMDERLGQPFERDRVLEEWRRLAVHQRGDRIVCTVGDRTFSGTWNGIDEHGRALLRHDGEIIAVSAGDLILS